ncbi:hypothetical protein Psal006b_02993 [Piscirickettsia salmonis]|uniref:S-adenosyl-L-methionine-dependent methyltransferase n=1 Tax=Piscirickettsia salmonis TaxID=1238 RepID=A0A1L6TG85_PISSA|nr:DUF938 domain-containing protein [Piscirickettsia salmonis]AKP74663.1 methyltransferase [Piscirickettsia salmonis LF-89 = ATCC VR-1361]ALB21419.1 S-adenosyl-L-methionine-dependent methyltransferase [Piscirickettsia salmonis]ALY01651.1 methyltransferase [Piscirickettsia salmonis]AMA41163.1 methyltransferase [Piscirickettsia salmonis]AOS36352.1 methyltransferase [Piscirickettsia salmonis]
MEKPCSAAAERNKTAILPVLKSVLADCKRVLEFGSGTGQHAVYFAREMPWLQWQTGDRKQQHRAILAWLADAKLLNCAKPLNLEVDAKQWDCSEYDVIFTANTLHILSWSQVKRLFEKVDQYLEKQGKFVIYGPFNYQGKFTSISNAEFDAVLKENNLLSGIRDFEKVIDLAKSYCLDLAEDVKMPANNRLLILERKIKYFKVECECE